MTLPLVVLAIFSVCFGWLGISEHFPLIGGLIPNFIHEFVGQTLLEMPEAVPFSFVPLGTSLVVALGGLTLGWWVYKSIKAGEMDPVEKLLGPSISNVLKNKYYFDELYHFMFVRPANWMAVTFTSLWMDRMVIDGILHAIASLTSTVGHFFRNYIDKPIVNGSGDLVADSTQKLGAEFRTIQTGRIQQYMVLALVGIGIFGAFYYIVLPPLLNFLHSLGL